MAYASIAVEGGLFPSDLLNRIATGDAEGQRPADFGLDGARRLVDEIQSAFSDARSFWDAFQRRLERSRESKTTITREDWVVPFLELLGFYQIQVQRASAEAGGEKYPISHRAGEDPDAPPVHVVALDQELDKRDGARRSPHALVQDYLNRSDAVWGIVTNGKRLRLLRDSVRLSRPTYLEFDLEGLVTGNQYSEFVLLYRLLHSSRFPRDSVTVKDSWLEKYYWQGIDEGGRVRDKLRDGVKEALRVLGTAFLAHPDSRALQDKFAGGRLDAPRYYRQLLRLVYRLLFLMVAEERRLIFPPGGDTTRQAVYAKYYGVTRLRDRADRYFAGDSNGDLRLGLRETFRLFCDNDAAQKLGLAALDGELFGPHACEDLEEAGCTNGALLTAIRRLSTFVDEGTGRGRDSSHSIDRPRFLGLTEFGPGNVIYHEGRKHRVDSAILPPGGIDERLRRARLCTVCGYAHDEEAVTLDLCEHCGTRLDAATAEFPQRLLEQPTMRTRAAERISSDEEERIRSGYKTSTHFRFAPGAQVRRCRVTDGGAETILEVVYAPAARIWRINHGWRQGDHNGFQIDTQTGRWQRRDVDMSLGEENDPEVPLPLAGVKPFVTDTRNLMLLRPLVDAPTDDFLMPLLYAIKRGIQFVYQVEEQEVAAELIGNDENRRLLFWEAAEGGTGVWERLIEEPGAFAAVARQALQVCHFDPHMGEEEAGHDPRRCAVACYECLLSYANQLEHHHLDRRLIREFLVWLSRGVASQVATARSREEQYQWLCSMTDPGSNLEIPFLEFLYRGGYRLPDLAQNRPAEGIAAQPDFYYDREGVPGVCVFVDGSDHNERRRQERDAEARAALEGRGYRVISIRFDHRLDAQVSAHPDVFGTGS